MATSKKTKIIDWKTTDERFVVFLDIMGFKDFVARNSHDFVYNMMKSLSKSKKVIEATFLDDELGAEYKTKDIYTTSFSDSIILFSSDDSSLSFEMIITSAAFFISEAMKNSIPMKGAMAYGTISVDKIQQIYFGQPLIDAFLLQEEVNYYGAILHNSVDNYINKNTAKLSKEAKKFLLEKKTPLKSGLMQHNNINWFRFLGSDLEDLSKAKKDFEKIVNSLRLVTSGSPRKYIDNTVEFYNSL
ncbi:MAG: hypothetical protein ABI691_08735 [Ginsengibacter sp.]